MKKDWSDLSVPPPSDGAREKARHRAMIAYRQARSTPRETASAPRPFFLRPRFLSGALACAVLAGVLTWTSHRSSEFDDSVVLAQMQELFGPALSAVVEKDGQVAVLTDSRAQMTPAQPVVIEVQQGENRLRILGFSGREVRIPLADRSVRVDPLITANGNVILVGDDFVIDGSSPRHDGAVFRAHHLDVML